MKKVLFVILTLLTAQNGFFVGKGHPDEKTLQKQINEFYETQIPSHQKVHDNDRELFTKIIEQVFNGKEIVKICVHPLVCDKKIYTFSLNPTPLNKTIELFCGLIPASSKFEGKQVNLTLYILLFLLSEEFKTDNEGFENESSLQKCALNLNRIYKKINLRDFKPEQQKSYKKTAIKVALLIRDAYKKRLDQQAKKLDDNERTKRLREKNLNAVTSNILDAIETIISPKKIDRSTSPTTQLSEEEYLLLEKNL